MRHFWIGLMGSVFLITTGCAGREALCLKVCEKASECAEDQDGYEDMDRCEERCAELATATQERCEEEFTGLSKCMKKRYDCDGSRDDACERRRRNLDTCLNAEP
jgi:hypothetical protein